MMHQVLTVRYTKTFPKIKIFKDENRNIELKEMISETGTSDNAARWNVADTNPAYLKCIRKKKLGKFSSLEKCNTFLHKKNKCNKV